MRFCVSIYYLAFLWSCLLASGTLVQAQDAQTELAPIIDLDARFQPVYGSKGMVAAQEALAADVGLEILKQGGNAVDAAVAVGFALAVTLPKAGNIGGGGFMLLHLAQSNQTIALDFREIAPAKAHRDMFLDENGNVHPSRSKSSYLSVGTPGTPAGLIHALDNYGSMPLAKVIAPAIALAEKGFPVTHGLHFDLSSHQKRMTSPATAAIFFKHGAPPAVNEVLVQEDLAWTLRQISEKGKDGFYKGEVAQRLSSAIIAGGGLISTEDLANYKIVETLPVRGTYRGYEIASMPPPSSGGIHIIQLLNLMEAWPLQEYGANSAQTIHLIAEAMKLAYADRSEYLGDPAFCKVPINALTSKAYADELRKGIHMQKARPSTEIKPGKVAPYEGPDTTHYSVMDKNGNAVSVTYTLNFSFGSGLVAEGTGVLLNNEMDDFSSKPGTPNAFGLLGGEANAIQGGKRPLSSMTPTIVFKDGKPYLVTGSPGGSRIITTVLQIISNIIDHEMNVATASCMPRFHHQWYPDVLRLEQGISIDTQRILKSWGHNLEQGQVMGSTQSIMLKDGLLQGASDPRRPGAATVAY